MAAGEKIEADTHRGGRLVCNSINAISDSSDKDYSGKDLGSIRYTRDFASRVL